MLVVPPSLMFVATRLLETELRVATADNDINALKSNGSIPEGYTVNHFRTDTLGWDLTTDVPNGMKHFVRTPLANSMDGEFDTGNVRYKARERYSFANLTEPLELPDLIAVQRESFDWFLNKGLAETFRDISPIKDFSEDLQLELTFRADDPDHNPGPKHSPQYCREHDLTYAAQIYVDAAFRNAKTGEIKEQNVFLGEFPIMTEKGTFIISGTERVVVSQLVRSPGVIFEPGERYRLRNLSKHQLVKGTIHPSRGEWLEFDVEAKPGKEITAGTRVAKTIRDGSTPCSCAERDTFA